MALINCPECGKEISSQSDKCIHCGYPLRKNETAQESDIHDETSYMENTNSPFFSNKDKADKMQILTFCIAIPLLILGFTISSVMFLLETIIGICMIPTSSYIEAFSHQINGRTRSGKKFTVKMSEITNVALGGEQITIYTATSKYSVNCGNAGEQIAAYIHNSKSL